MADFDNDWNKEDKYCESCNKVTRHLIGLGVMECSVCNNVEVYD